MNREHELYRIEDVVKQIHKLNDDCQRNMKSLNLMMLELKGVIAMVRASAKKNDLYKPEFEVIPQVFKKDKNFDFTIEIEYKD